MGGIALNRTSVRSLDYAGKAMVLPAEQGGPAAPTPPNTQESILYRILLLAAEAVGAPIGFISLAAAGRQLVRVQVGINGPLRPADALLPARLIDRAEPIVIGDLHAAEWRGLVPASGLPGARFVVIIPFGESGGPDAGTLCIIDTVPRDAPGEQTIRLLTGLAALAGAERWPGQRPAAMRGVLEGGSLEESGKRKSTEAALAASEERLRFAVQAAHLGVWDVDLTTGERRWSDELLAMVGLPPNTEPSIATALEIIHPEDRSKFQSVVTAASGDLLPVEFEVALRIHRHNDGAVRWLKTTGWKSVTGTGNINRLIVTVQDVTAERDAEERIRWAATHDPLTLLPNRLAVQQELDSAIALARAAHGRIGLMLFDVDNLKRINDTLGHDAGDALLRVFARRLIDVAPPGATIGRLGGDEFAILMPLQGTADVEICAAALIRRLREPFVFNGRTLDCAASIGAAIFPDHGTNPTELLKSADLALYTAKTGGRGRSQLFRSEMRSDLQRQFSMINLAKDALANGRVEAFYQPKIDLHTHALVGFEALLRWRDPHGATHLPADITAAFEDSDLSIELTDRILDKVTADLRRWLDQGFDPISIAVNTSANDFRYDNFAERVLECLARRNLPPQRLEIEVTETVFLGRSAPFVERALRLLSAEGIRIALDDFGTGYASLSHLKHYPVDVLKIDRSFISNLEHSPNDAAIADAVIALGRNLGISVVAEGIETMAQARHLRQRGCAVGQGFLFGHPVRAGATFPAWRDRLFRG